MECKGSSDLFNPRCAPVDLIETLWNVKYQSWLTTEYLAVDLIETLWNVKVLPRIMCRKLPLRFNRDIVECKAHASDLRAQLTVQI